MSDDVRSGHGNPESWGKYSDIHVKITMVCAIDRDRVTEYWWDVTPSGAQLKRAKDANDFTRGKIRWELCAFDVRTGDPLGCAIESMSMDPSSGWSDAWGVPKENPKHSNRRHWRMDVEVPGGAHLERFAYTVRIRVGRTAIQIDPEVDFEPGE